MCHHQGQQYRENHEGAQLLAELEAFSLLDVAPHQQQIGLHLLLRIRNSEVPLDSPCFLLHSVSVWDAFTGTAVLMIQGGCLGTPAHL